MPGEFEPARVSPQCEQGIARTALSCRGYDVGPVDFELSQHPVAGSPHELVRSDLTATRSTGVVLRVDHRTDTRTGQSIQVEALESFSALSRSHVWFRE